MNNNKLICLDDSIKNIELTEFESDLLNISQKYGIDQFNKIIAEKKQFNYTRVLSHIRGNCVEWIPFKKTDKVLEIGAEYGSITRTLAKKAGHIISFDTLWNKCVINSNINKDYDNITFVAGSFKQLKQYLNNEKFDYITLIGCFDFAAQFIDDVDCHKILLNELSHLLKKDGKLIISIENKYGLKYWSGSVERRSGLPFEGITGYKNISGVSTFSKNNLINLLKKCNYSHTKFYYPYPDYEFAMSIFSDNYLPNVNSFSNGKYNWEANRTELFEEFRAFEELSRDGYFSEFSNSFLVFASKEELILKEEKQFETIFTKYSNERSPMFAIRTEIQENQIGEKKVIKYPLTKECNGHMEKIECFRNKLQEQYSKTRFILNRAKKINSEIQFEFLRGHSYADELLRCCNDNDFDLFISKIKNFFDEVLKANNDGYFSASPNFRKVFGSLPLPANLKCGSISNIDLIFENIIIDENDEWNIIDYEWMFNFPVPVKYILFRSIYYFFRGGNNGNLRFNKEWEDECYKLAGISQYLYKVFFRMEVNYQKYVAGKLVPIRNLPANNYHTIVGKSASIFIDIGDGFNKDHVDFTETKVLNNGRIEFTYELLANIKKIRIDPIERKCMVYILKLVDENGRKLSYKTNGKKIKKNLFIYNNGDPQIIINDINKIKKIDVILEVMPFTPEINKII